MVGRARNSVAAAAAACEMLLPDMYEINEVEVLRLGAAWCLRVERSSACTGVGGKCGMLAEGSGDMKEGGAGASKARVSCNSMCGASSPLLAAVQARGEDTSSELAEWAWRAAKGEVGDAAGGLKPDCRLKPDVTLKPMVVGNTLTARRAAAPAF